MELGSDTIPMNYSLGIDVEYKKEYTKSYIHR